MERTEDLIDKVTEMIEAGMDDMDQQDGFRAISEDQPGNASWLTVDMDFGIYATDATTFFSYESTQHMQHVILKALKSILTPGLLKYYTTGQIDNIRIIIGPDSLSGENQNVNNGIVISQKYKSKKT